MTRDAPRKMRFEQSHTRLSGSEVISYCTTMTTMQTGLVANANNGGEEGRGPTTEQPLVISRSDITSRVHGKRPTLESNRLFHTGGSIQRGAYRSHVDIATRDKTQTERLYHSSSTVGRS